jgi:hypothetical protein
MKGRPWPVTMEPARELRQEIYTRVTPGRLEGGQNGRPVVAPERHLGGSLRGVRRGGHGGQGT